MMQFPVVGQFVASRSPDWVREDTVNWYVMMDDEGKTPKALAPMPGIKLLSGSMDFDDEPIRINGLYTYSTSYYAVAGENFYRVNNNGRSFIGTLQTVSGYISWSNNTTQIALVDGKNLYIYNINTGIFTTVDLSTFPPNPQMIYYQDSRFILSFLNSNQYFYSAQGDGTSFNISNFLILQSRPDTATGVTGTNERLFLLGTKSVEIWAPVTYASDQPFYRDDNSIYEFGNNAIAAIVKGIIDNGNQQPVINFVFWLFSNENGVGGFCLSTGGLPVKASTLAVDLELRSFSTVSDCYCVIYKEPDHLFIECNFPTANKTLVFDVTTWMWFHKERLDGSYSPINAHTWYQNQHIVGHRATHNLYTLDANYLTEDGTPIRRARITRTVIDEDFNWLQGNLFEVNCETGQVEPGIVPKLFIYFSINGGRNWSNPYVIPMGETGQYFWKIFIEGLGIGYSYVFKLEIFDPVRAYIFGGRFDYGVLKQ